MSQKFRITSIIFVVYQSIYKTINKDLLTVIYQMIIFYKSFIISKIISIFEKFLFTYIVHN